MPVHNQFPSLSIADKKMCLLDTINMLCDTAGTSWKHWQLFISCFLKCAPKSFRRSDVLSLIEMFLVEYCQIHQNRYNLRKRSIAQIIDECGKKSNQKKKISNLTLCLPFTFSLSLSTISYSFSLSLPCLFLALPRHRITVAVSCNL